MKKRKKTKKVVYNIQCTKNPDHIFEKDYTIYKGSENKETELQAFCPYCDELVTFKIKGVVVPDKELLRGLDDLLSDEKRDE